MRRMRELQSERCFWGNYIYINDEKKLTPSVWVNFYRIVIFMILCHFFIQTLRLFQYLGHGNTLSFHYHYIVEHTLSKFTGDAY